MATAPQIDPTRLASNERAVLRASTSHRKLNWPNVLTGTRIALMPEVVLVAMAGWRGWFVALLGVALVTDVLDGYLARKLNEKSDFGRKLDSIADYLALFCGLAGIALLWPDVMRRDWIWFVAVMTSFFAAMAFSFFRLGRAPCYHTWASKFTVAGCALSLIPLLAGWTATPAHVVATLQVLVGVEEIVIVLLVPWHVGEMKSVWHAWRLRQLSKAHYAVPAT